MPRPRPITKEQGDELLELYKSGQSRNSLARKYGSSRRFITDYIRERGAETRGIAEACMTKLPNGNPFVDAETKENASYWLGFLMADGCLSKRSSRRTPSLICALAGKDSGHLQKLADFIGVGNVKLGTQKSPHDGKILQTARYVISNMEIVNSVEGYGLTERKSLTAKPDQRMIWNRHFWRGYVDGNGSLQISKKTKKEKIALFGSKSMVDQFVAFCRHHVETTSKPFLHHGCYNYAVHSHLAIKIVRLLYDDATIYLDRKKAIADLIQPRPDARRKKV